MHACTINHVLKVVSVNVSGLDTRNRCNDHQSVLLAAFSKNWPVRHTRTWRKTAEALKAPGERRRSWTCWDGLPTPYRWGTSTCQSKSAAAPRLNLIGQRLIFINTSNSALGCWKNLVCGVKRFVYVSTFDLHVKIIQCEKWSVCVCVRTRTCGSVSSGRLTARTVTSQPSSAQTTQSQSVRLCVRQESRPSTHRPHTASGDTPIMHCCHSTSSVAAV